MMSTNSVNSDILLSPLRPPSLDLLSPFAWQVHQNLAYMFARRVRHDLINVQSAFQMVEMVEELRQAGSNIPLPPGFEPQEVQKRIRIALRQVGNMTNDITFLSQITNPAAYRHSFTQSPQALLNTAILNRLGSEAPLPDAITDPNLENNLVLSMNGMLESAITAFYFQWTPGLHPHTAVQHFTAKLHSDRLVLSFPIEIPQEVEPFLNELNQLPQYDSPPAIPDEVALNASTAALWLARFIILVHGGNLCLGTSLDHQPTVHIALPLAG